MLRPKRNRWWRTCLWTACVIAATCARPSMVQAYELLTTDHGASVHWREPTVTLRVAEELETYFAGVSVVTAIEQAAATWSALDGVPELLVERGCWDEPGFHRGKLSNGLYLVRDWAMLPNALAVTISTFETTSGRLVDADVLVNANFPFSWLISDAPSGGHYDLPSVLTHELGHVIGLGDTPDVPDATMWPSILAGDIYQRDLAPDDEAGVASIYPAVEENALAYTGGDEGCGGASVVDRAVRARGGHALSSLLLSLWVLWLCARRCAVATRRHVIVLGGALLFGGLVPGSTPPPPRAPASTQTDARVRQLPRDHPVAQRRLAAFLHGAERLFAGPASTRVERRGGLIWTLVRVRSASGSVELEVPGGSLGGVTQVVSGHTPPLDGERLLIAWRKRGPHGWAQLRDGAIQGGTLGAGPAIEWE